MKFKTADLIFLMLVLINCSTAAYVSSIKGTMNLDLNFGDRKQKQQPCMAPVFKTKNIMKLLINQSSNASRKLEDIDNYIVYEDDEENWEDDYLYDELNSLSQELLDNETKVNDEKEAEDVLNEYISFQDSIASEHSNGEDDSMLDSLFEMMSF
jgi:hypothetical protein